MKLRQWNKYLILMFLPGLIGAVQARTVKQMPPTPWRVEAGVLKRGEHDWYVARKTTTIPLRIDPNFWFGAIVQLPKNVVSQCHAVFYQPKSNKIHVFEVRDGVYRPHQAVTVTAIDKKGLQAIKIKPMPCQDRFIARVKFDEGDQPGPYIFYLYVNKRLAGQVIFKVIPAKSPKD